MAQTPLRDYKVLGNMTDDLDEVEEDLISIDKGENIIKETFEEDI